MTFGAIALCSGLRQATKSGVFAAGRQPLIAGLGYQSKTGLQTFAPLKSSAKTEIQQWGWGYLAKQKALKRPISPHLSVYKPQLTWVVSGMHRISGAVMGGAIGVVAFGMMVAPFDFPRLIKFIRDLDLPRPIIYAFKWCVVWPITFHALNGIRFLGFDMAYGIKLPQVYKTGWLVVILSMAFATWVASWKTGLTPISNKSERFS